MYFYVTVRDKYPDTNEFMYLTGLFHGTKVDVIKFIDHRRSRSLINLVELTEPEFDELNVDSDDNNTIRLDLLDP